MSSRKPIEHGLGWLYDQATCDEDARACKDIPDETCVEQPRNFFLLAGEPVEQDI
jgi:hypothetical protein